MKRTPAIDLRHHRRLRAILRHHQNAATTTVPRAAILKWAREFGIAEGDTLQLESNDELIILFDFLIYHHRRRGRTLAQNYLAGLPPTQDPDETMIRQAMGSPTFSAFNVRAARPSVGVEVRDLVRGGTTFVVDEALSTSVRPNAFLALRLLPLPGYAMTSGAGFPLSRDVVGTIKQLFLTALRGTEGTDLTHLSPEAEDELATVITGAAFIDGTTAAIHFK